MATAQDIRYKIAITLEAGMNEYVLFQNTSEYADLDFAEFISLSGYSRKIDNLLSANCGARRKTDIRATIRRGIDDAPLTSVRECVSTAIKRGRVRRHSLWAEYLAEHLSQEYGTN